MGEMITRLRLVAVRSDASYPRRAGVTGRAWRYAGASALAAAALWVGANSLGTAVAKSNIDLAASLNPGSASILGNRSRRMIESGRIEAATVLAQKALRRDATDIAAVRTMGLAAQASGNASRAKAMLDYAKRLSRRDLQTHLWAIEDHVARGETGEVLQEYDLALRTSLPARDILFPVLANAVSDRVIARGLVLRLRNAPLWRDAFLTFVASDERVAPVTAVTFLRAAQASGVAAPPEGLAVLVARSLDANAEELAWAAYALKRPTADRRLVRDATFKATPKAPSAFDWTLSNDGSIFSQAVEQDGSGRLEVEAGAGSAGVAAQQVQALPPGRYRLAVDVGPVPQGASLIWTVTCRNGPELTKLTVAGSGTRPHVSNSFTVPDACRVQTLMLFADAGESPEGLRTAINRIEVVPARR